MPDRTPEDASSIAVGQTVQTPLGKGVVRGVRNNGRLLVEIGGRSLVVEAGSVRAIEPPKRRKQGSADPLQPAAAGDDDAARSTSAADIDLHGLTVFEALAKVEISLDRALLNGHARLRLIHGKSGGRIRAALHQRLRELSSVRAFRVDPGNAGVTIVEL